MGNSTTKNAVLDGAYKKATWHLIPFIFVCYFFNYLDRVNVGFAKLEMLEHRLRSRRRHFLHRLRPQRRAQQPDPA